MKKFAYEGYTKKVNGKVHFIIKKYELYPEETKIAPVLVSMGMNQSFEKACQIANVVSRVAYEELIEKFKTLQSSNKETSEEEATEKKLKTGKSSGNSLLNFIPGLKWANS